MAKIESRHIDEPDELRPFLGHGELKVFHFEGGTVGIARFEPGWRWSVDVGPIAGTRSCQAPHSNLVLSGRIRIRMDDGEEIEQGPGDLAIIPPGHDAWVVGDEPCVLLDWSGMEHYAEPRQGLQDEPLHPV